MLRDELESFLNNLLSSDLYNDYGPNGLQVEGKKEIKKITFAVSATRESIEKSVELKSDCLITHHGIIWKSNGMRPITKTYAKRIIPLIKNDINLISYHLPLDGHPQLGNNAVIGNLLNLTNQEPFGDYKGMPIGIKGKLSTPLKVKQLREKLSSILQHDVILSSPDEAEKIERIGVISGGGNSYWPLSLEHNLQAFITGEMKEHDWNEAKESGIHMFAGGHYATEVFGVKKLMETIQNKFNIECCFIDSSNPV